MERDDIELFLGKRSKVFTTRNFKFEGEILSIGSTCLVIDDRDGMKTIELSDVREINEVKRRW